MVISHIVYAILAHNHLASLEDLIDSLRVLSPGNRVVLFNGGTDKEFGENISVDHCPYSLPLKHGKLANFHYGVMKMLENEKYNYDFLVTLDSDMLLTKPGFSEFLDHTMADSLYMGVNLQKIEKGTDWIIGRRFLYKWPKRFKHFFEIETPYGSFNPGQVFRREYVSHFVNDPMTGALMKAVEKSKLAALEEVIYATYAVKIQGNPICNPGSHAMVHRRHLLNEIQEYLQDPSVYFVHKVGMDVNDPDRVFLQQIRQRKVPDIQSISEDYVKQFQPTYIQQTLTRLKDLYIRVFV
ncbi:hypothetical protein [Bacillus sp. JJ1562]|uniref:hypothetical protein n=1 Tax=Bacillus sp. JJ1562 TaxID=3122960 RepID=UPI003003869C